MKTSWLAIWITSEEHIINHTQHATSLICLIAVFSTIAGLLFGFDTGIISGALAFIQHSFHIQDQRILESIVSAVPLGALIGAIFSKSSSRRIGRRQSIINTAILFVIGTIFAIFAPNIWMLLIGRLLMGFAVGLSSMVVPMYLSEVAPANHRGAIVFCYQLAITLGLLLAFIINLAFAHQENWRAMFAIGLIPSILLGVGMLFLPASPRWLVLSGKESSARRVLQKLRQPEHVESELNAIKISAHHQQLGLRNLVKKPFRGLALLTFSLFMFQQLTGINTIMYYAPTIYKYAGFHGNTGQLIASAADGIVFVLATIVSIFLVDQIGRRILFKIGYIGMIICLLLLAADLHGMIHYDMGKIALLAALSYLIFFGISMGPLPYLLMSELFPLNIKSTGMALASCANWGFNVLVSSTFLSLIHAIGISMTFLGYAICTLIGLIIAYYFVPETKGTTLDNIEDHLYQGTPLRKMGN